MKKIAVFSMAAILWMAAATGFAADVFYDIPLTELKVTEGTIPTPEQMQAESPVTEENWQLIDWMIPYAVLEGGGEAYVADGDETQGWEGRFRRRLVVRAPEGAKISGRIYLQSDRMMALTKARFEFPESAKPTGEAVRAFHRARANHYDTLANGQLPGELWFRRQAAASRGGRAGFGDETMTPEEFAERREWQRQSELDASIDLFSGRRAMMENLHLDRALRITTRTQEMVAIDSIPGIVIPPFDWKPRLTSKAAELDPLAALIPADQHALFFPSFQAMIALMDEAQANAAKILPLIVPEGTDAMTRERYQRQLCLADDELARLLGPALIKSVAFTGGDPYLRSGSDVAVLFETDQPEALVALLEARSDVSGTRQSITTVSGSAKTTAGLNLEFSVLHVDNRRIHRFLSTIENRVVVANSLVQLIRIAEVAAGKTPSLAKLDEYRFFRQRYERGGGETALLVLSDDTIRRWCGPRMRIAASRRARAIAALTELQMRRLDALTSGQSAENAIAAAGTIEDAGEITWLDNRPHSSKYGSLTFITPIAELDLKEVTKEEAEAYGRFRDRYQSRWRENFDPIALRFGVAPEKVSLDLTVMPLILESEYGEFMALSAGAKIAPEAGDRHADAMVHFAMAINPNSRQMQQAGSMLQSMSGPQAMQAAVNPLAWIGGSLAVYADEDPVWQEISKAGSRGHNFEKFINRLPIALRVESKDPLRLAAFLTFARGMADQSAPGLVTWTTQTRNETPYVKISARTGGNTTDSLSIWYAAMPEALVVSLREETLHKALDRAAARKAAGTGATPEPWPGDQMSLLATGTGMKALGDAQGENHGEAMRAAAWAKIPILNEWRRRLAQQDPVAFHAATWGERLTDPAGGSFQWNEEWQTMESTSFGHPGEPKIPAGLSSPADGLKGLEAGVTFENGGLRAKGTLHRPAQAGQ